MTVERTVRLDDLVFDRSDDGALAVHADGRDLSWSELAERADIVARALHAAGVGAGRTVGVMLPDGADLVATLFGVWRAGGVYAPLNPRLGDQDLDHVLGSVDPAVVVTVAAHRDRFPGRRLVLLDGDPVHVDGRHGDHVHDASVALVQFTSGTTGRPKAVLLEHAGVLELIDGVLAKLRGGSARREPDRDPMPNLIPVSLSLWAGIYNVVFAFRSGAPVLVMGRFSTTEFAELVDRFQLRSTVLPPAAMTMLADDEAVTDLSPLKYVRSISAPLSPLQARRFRDRFDVGILNCWGQTEIGGEVVGWNAADLRVHGDDKLGAVGRPHEGVQIRIVDRNGRDVASAQDEGEILVKTPAMSSGYADGADLGDRLTDDGWFRTGDVGRHDADGFLWIDGRVSDMINRGGLKVFPAEVEEVLRLHPAVGDAAVVARSDDRLGEVPIAFVEGAAEPVELEALCREHLAAYKVPAAFTVVDTLPRNEVGKVLKNQLAQEG